MRPQEQAKAEFSWQIRLLLDQQLTQDERMVRDAAHDYCQGKLAPRIWKRFATKNRLNISPRWRTRSSAR